MLAQDLAAVPLTGHVFVLVEIADVNDNSPYSIEPMYFARLEFRIFLLDFFFKFGFFLSPS